MTHFEVNVIGQEFLNRYHFDPGVVPESTKHRFAIFPSKSERADIGDTEPCHNRWSNFNALVIELAVHHRLLGPIDQLRESDFVPEIGCDSIGDGLPGNQHDGILRALMTTIDRYIGRCFAVPELPVT